MADNATYDSWEKKSYRGYDQENWQHLNLDSGFENSIASILNSLILKMVL